MRVRIINNIKLERGFQAMSRWSNQVVRLLLVCVFLIVAAAPGLAAEVRRVPSSNLVEQGFQALTLDVEGADGFRYVGEEGQQHIYKGKIKPGDTLKFVIRATLAKRDTLPLTGRSCFMRMEIISKKGGEVIKKENFKKDNRISVFLNYTVPEGADTLEVNETFVLQNKSKEEKFNQKCTTKNKLILSTADDAAAAAKTDSKAESGDKKTGDSGDQKTDGNNGKNTGNENDKKTPGGDAEKKNDGDKKSDTETGKTDAGDAKESKGSGKGMIAGAVIAVAAIAGGGYFFMKKRKEEQAANEEIARKEKLRQQAIRKQQELQQQAGTQAIQRQQEPPRQNIPAQEQHEMMQQAGAAGVAGAASTMDNAGTVQQQTSFCTNCGAPLKPGTRFCESCGAKV